MLASGVGRTGDRKLDIVIVHYALDKSVETLLVWNDFLLLPQVAELKPHVYLYIQNPDFTNHSLFNPLLKYGGKVISLDNVGREGRPYLHHIITHYTKLPKHIIFSQDIPRMELFFFKFAKLFSPSIGFLPLSFVGHQFCEDNFLPRAVMSETYALLTGKFCPAFGFYAAYEGQFAVSRRRILARPLSTYRVLLDINEAPADHWIHTVHDNSYYKHPSNPFFCHIMERAWSVTFDCHDLSLLEECRQCHNAGYDNCSPHACACHDDSLEPPLEPKASNRSLRRVTGL